MGCLQEAALLIFKAEACMYQPIGLLWGIVTLIFGVAILAYPRFLHYAVGIYLIVVGLWAIIPHLR
jgi:hypothetical protein